MDLLDVLKNKFSSVIVSTHQEYGQDTVAIRREGILLLLSFLKNNPELDFNVLMDLSAVDYLGRTDLPRFEVIYHLYSLRFNRRIRIKALVDEKDCEIDSAVALWPGANWFEREVWDMFGVRFRNHPNLKRILMYEAFEGHPLRKDYPVNRRQPLIEPVS